MLWSQIIFCIFTTMINLLDEIVFKTARAGGKGGQHVNKVETLVEGKFHVADSQILTERQKNLILENIGHKLTKDGYLQVKSQKERSQLENKEDVIVKIHVLISNALIRRKKRRPTKPTKESKQKRLKNKKLKSSVKKDRQKIAPSAGDA